MSTTHIITGSDKNAGKTTVLLEVLQRLRRRGQPFVLTSIGINGEAVDAYEGLQKPTITLQSGDWCVTTPRWLEPWRGQISIEAMLLPPAQLQPLALAKLKAPAQVVLEGPNTRTGIRHMQTILRRIRPEAGCIIDGSIDRQFLFDPALTDEVSFALLWSERKPQQNKARGFIEALRLPKSSTCIVNALNICLNSQSRSLLLNSRLEPVYHSTVSPFMDEELLLQLQKHPDGHCWLGGALTRSLRQKLQVYPELHIHLNHFALYQSLGTTQSLPGQKQSISIFRQPARIHLYLREDVPSDPALMGGLNAINLYRQDLQNHADSTRP